MKRLEAPLVHRGPDPEQARYNEEVGNALRVLGTIPLINHTIVEVDVTTSPTKVSHLLKRPWTGWHVVDRTSDTGVYRVDGPATDPANPSTHFYLQAGAGVTVKVLIF